MSRRTHAGIHQVSMLACLWPGQEWHSNTSGGADGETEGCREGECRYYLDISPWCPVHKLRWSFVISAVVTLLVTYYYLLLVTATDM